MGFYPQVVNIQNAIVTSSDENVTGGLGFFDVADKTTKYAFQATVTPFANSSGDSFEFKVSDRAEFFREFNYDTFDNYSGTISSSFSASFALGGNGQNLNGNNVLIHPGLYIENQFITESFSGSNDFSIFNTQLTASKGLNFYHKHMSGSLTQSLYLTASEGFFVTGSSFFKGETNFNGNVTGSSNLRVAGTSKLVGNVEADGNLTVGGNLTIQGATTTVSSSNTTFKDSIIGLGITGSETFNNVGDRGIIFGRGASASSTLPGLWWDGTQFNLAESATSPASSSFGSITSYSPIRVGTLTLGGTQVTSTAAELNILDGVTANTSEINILDGATLSVSELNVLDGITSSTSELNILDNATITVEELNLLDASSITSASGSALRYDGSSLQWEPLSENANTALYLSLIHI